MTEERRQLALSAHILTALGMDRLLLQHMRRQEQDRKVTRPAMQQQRVNGLRRERRMDGVSARQQRIRRNGVRDKIDQRRAGRLCHPYVKQAWNRSARRFMDRFKAGLNSVQGALRGEL